MKKSKPKIIYSERKKTKKWIGRKIFDFKTGESEWKMKKNQETKDYEKKPLKGEHLHTSRRNWKKGFERLAHNFAKKNKQFRKNERNEKNRIKRMR